MWHSTGTKRRAGIAVPLFSIYSDQSICIGEIPDLTLLVDWCIKTGMSIIQLLPINDTGDDFAPYSSVSTFALDPMYLAIRKLKNIDISSYDKDLSKLKKKYRALFGRVNYKIKKAKIDLLRKIYRNHADNTEEFKNYVSQNLYWLKDYALYKIIKEKYAAGWEKWNDSLKYRNKESLDETEEKNPEKLPFHYWVQWQLSEQMKQVKKYAKTKDVFLMGDLPFLVARESADVWAHQNYFRTDLSAGAPPTCILHLGKMGYAAI
jgi:4-alpha-glucanotransferase